MAIFYATFMQKQAFKRKYVKIEAQNRWQARDAMFAHFGDRFMTVYEEDGFNEQVVKYNLKQLCEIEVINHGTEEHPNVEYV